MAKPQTSERELPPIPPKHYFTIGEVSQLCDIKPHVLRYWEQEFLQLRQVKRRGNRRYYQPREVELIRHIRTLLYERGFTITGARHELSQKYQRQATALPTSSESDDRVLSPPLPEHVDGHEDTPVSGSPSLRHDARLREELQAIVLLLSR